MLHHGLYEQVINNQLTSELAEIPEARKAIAPIDKAEASKVLAQYLADVVQKGCYIQLEKKAARYILDNIRASYGNTAGLVTRVASFTDDTGLELTLGNFLDYYHLDPRAVYKFTSFSRLCARADATPNF